MDPLEDATINRWARAEAIDPYGEHEIEYWVPDGDRLIPATLEDIMRIHEFERARTARRRLETWKRQDQRPAPRQPLRWLRPLAARWPARGSAARRQAPAEADAHAARSRQPSQPSRAPDV